MRTWRWRHHAIILPPRVMAAIIQRNIRGSNANTEELQLLYKQYNPQIMAVQGCQRRDYKVINLNGFPF